MSESVMNILNNQVGKQTSQVRQVIHIRNSLEQERNNTNSEATTNSMKNVDLNLNDLRINNKIDSAKTGKELKEEGKFRNSNHRKKNELARERWKILAKALLKPKKISSKQVQNKDISVRRFTTFELMVGKRLEKCDKLEDCWLKYSTKIQNNKYSLDVHHLHHVLTAKDLVGFNNTGNICIWPSEEVLTYYLLSHLDLVETRKVLELGGGMTCLAGVAAAKFGRPRSVHLTDGNHLSVKNVEEIIARNQLVGKASAFVLEWGDRGKMNDTYDVVLSADCLFFDEARMDLVATIWHCLAPTGTALVMAPRRGTTLDVFVKEAVQRGFLCVVQVYYNEVVWEQHMHFKDYNADYHDDLHYPILIILTKPHPVL